MSYIKQTEDKMKSAEKKKFKDSLKFRMELADSDRQRYYALLFDHNGNRRVNELTGDDLSYHLAVGELHAIKSALSLLDEEV
jgi:hypothetical protein